VNLFSGLPADPPSNDFIMRNAMDAQEVAVGWWPGDPRYDKAAFYAYAHPAPEGFPTRRSHRAPPAGSLHSASSSLTGRRSGQPGSTGGRAGVRPVGVSPRLLGVRVGSDARGQRRRHPTAGLLRPAPPRSAEERSLRRIVIPRRDDVSIEDFDVIVIGSGPAGEVAAGDLAGQGRSVAVVEAALVGGECAFYACMPSKALLRPAEVLAEARRVPGSRQAITGPLDVAATLARRDEVIHGLDDASKVGWLDERGITLIRGHGRLAGERCVSVGDRRYEARSAVVVASAAPPPSHRSRVSRTRGRGRATRSPLRQRSQPA